MAGADHTLPGGDDVLYFGTSCNYPPSGAALCS